MPPKKLTRKALKVCFPKVSQATWDYLFDAEKRVGLIECRTKGPDCLIYYDSELIKQWLCERGYYAPDDFQPVAEFRGAWAGLQVRRHSMAG